jgi:hypothetical protein
MQQSSFIGVLLARHVSGDFAHHQERRPVLEHVLLCSYPGMLLRGPCDTHAATFLDSRRATQQNWVQNNT